MKSKENKYAKKNMKVDGLITDEFLYVEVILRPKFWKLSRQSIDCEFKKVTKELEAGLLAFSRDLAKAKAQDIK